MLIDYGASFANRQEAVENTVTLAFAKGYVGQRLLHQVRLPGCSQEPF